MTALAAPADGGTETRSFGAVDLFLADSRLGFLVFNEVRHRCLHSVFGCSRENENLLTLVLALSAASATYEGARRVLLAPVPKAGYESAMSAFLLREAGFAVAGPRAAATPMFGSLVAFALVAGVALPKLRRAAHAARLAEHRVREHRIARYLAATTRGAEGSGAEAPA